MGSGARWWVHAKRASGLGRAAGWLGLSHTHNLHTHTHTHNCQECPHLHDSVRRLHAYITHFVSKRDEIFENFRLSARGSIRKPPNCLTWVSALLSLQNAGDKDSSSIIKTWNQTASANAQLIGRKALAVKNVLDRMGMGTLDVLLGAVSEFGWEDCPFNEETLSSKRIYPGHTFRVDGSKSWTARQTVSAKSLHLMMERTVWDHKHRTRVQRSEKEMADRAVQAAVVVALAQEARAAAPLTEEDIEKHLLSKWRQADCHVEVELRSVMALHEEKFNVRDLHFLKDMWEKIHHPTGAMAHSAEQIVVQAAELEGATFELTMKQIKYDAECFAVYLQKVSSFHKATYFKKLEWDQEQHRASEQAAQVFLERNTLWVQMDSGEVPQAYKDFCQKIRKQHDLLEEDLVRGQGDWMVGGWGGSGG